MCPEYLSGVCPERSVRHVSGHHTCLVVLGVCDVFARKASTCADVCSVPKPCPHRSSADELSGRALSGPTLEAENEPNLQGVGQSLKRLHARLVTAALDAGDRGVTGTHAPSQLFLGDAEGGAMPDHQPGQ